ncbi:MAG: hypothetical protein U0R65_09610 [Candidatus Nanopelagicales bacterium]|jgi:hypothetical protein
MPSIELAFEIDCEVDAAWEAIHSPAAAERLYGPLLGLRPMTELPARWESGSQATVRTMVLGLVPAGTQVIRTTDDTRRIGGVDVRIMRDSGRPLTGPLAVLSSWDHRMAVSPVAGNPARTLWRDRLVIGGPAAALLWPGLWLTWQWRRLRITQLAPTWSAASDRDFSDHASPGAATQL